MAQVPQAEWKHPSSDWQTLIDRYVRFRRVKAWRGRTHSTEGVLNPNRLTAAQGEQLKRRLTRVVEEQRLQTPSNREIKRVFDKHRVFAKTPGALQDLWRAYLLDRAGYTCRHCGRTAWDVHRELGATLRFQLDHARARSLLGTAGNDFDLRNIVVACRSCNVIKGQMPAARFRRELDSLARSVIANSAR